MGGKPHSPTLAHAQRMLQLCRKLIAKREMRARGHRGKTNMSRRIRWLQHKIRKELPAGVAPEVADLHTLSLEQLVAKEKVLKEAERKAAKEAGPNRSHYLNGLAEAKAKEGNMTVAKALTRLIMEEEQRTSHRRVKAVNGKLWGSKPLVLKKRGRTSEGREVSIDLNSKEEQEKEALDHFAERCQGTINPPPMTSPLLDDLGYAADAAEAEAVLRCDYPLDDIDIDPHAAEYLRQCQYIQPPPGVRDWDGTITTESHVQGVKKLKERTAPGPSDITPAHYKASLHVPGLVALDSALRNFCSRSGYSLRRYRRATTCVLEKSPGNHHVEDSRFIVCSEIDWNLNNKELGRQLKASASVRERGISAEQHGARSRHSTTVSPSTLPVSPNAQRRMWQLTW